MARLIRVPGLASLLVVGDRAEIDALIDHPALARAFVRAGPLVNRLVVASVDRQIRHDGQVLDAFRPKEDPERAARQQALRARLESDMAGGWPSAPVGELARYVVEGRHRRNAEAALAYAVAAPFLGLDRNARQDDAYRPIGLHLWRLHRRTERARRPLSISGLVYRVAGIDRRARVQILARTQDSAYGLHAVEITLANARDILGRMRRAIAGHPQGKPIVARDLAWAAIRTAPAVVLRQTGNDPTSLPHVEGRLPPRTLVMLRMRDALGADPDAAAGFEFASAHWSACPARRYVMGLFEAVAQTAADMARARGHR